MTGVGDEVPKRRATPAPALFDDVLVVSRLRRRSRQQARSAQISAAVHLVVLALVVLVPIFLPSEMPPRPDLLVNLIYDPPPPPPPPLLRGSPFKPQEARPETPKPVVEHPPKPDFTAPIETRPKESAKLVPDPGVRLEDQFGSETGSDLGDPAGMEGGVVGGVVGGTLGGVLGGVIGGTGTGPVADYDTPPRPIRLTKPQYPHEAFIKRVEGVVELEILIDSSGRVVRARVLRSMPLLDAAAIQTVYQWVFQPAVKHGRPVASIATAPVTFSLF